jgi:hypothetical protein
MARLKSSACRMPDEVEIALKKTVSWMAAEA